MLVGRGGLGEGASFGNAGDLGIASCVPAVMPGPFKKAPAMLPDPTAWIGPHPSRPDSKPVIDRSPRYRFGYFALGRDHIDLASAEITGKLIGEIASGQPPGVDPTPFRPDRF